MNIFQKALTSLGIDVMPHAFGLTSFATNTPISTAEIKTIKEKIKYLKEKRADDALLYCEEMFEREMDRGEKIESKAYNLLGVTGLSAAFVTGISSLLPDKVVEILPNQNIILMIIYIMIVISLTFTVLLAARVVIVGEYKFSYPSIESVFDSDTLAVKKERLNDYLYCYNNNHKIHNVKASYLIGSQRWFRNTIILFLVLAFVLAPSVFGNLNVYLIP